MRRILAIAAFGLALAACEEQTGPYLDYAGGGFVFNYRNADAYYGFVARRLRSLPEGATIEAEFELPGEANIYVTREAVRDGQFQWKFQTPTLAGIVRGHPYRTVLRVIGKDGTVVASYEHRFHTDIEQASLPDKPLVVGPVYTPNPELSRPGAPERK